MYIWIQMPTTTVNKYVEGKGGIQSCVAKNKGFGATK